MAHHKNNVPPITLAECIRSVTVTPDAPHNLLEDLRTKHGVNISQNIREGTVAVYTSSKKMKQHPSKRQLDRARQFQRRTR
jgi:hypothetical protein